MSSRRPPELRLPSKEPHPFHFRDRDGIEVDLVLESGDGRVVGVEVKAGATVRAEDQTSGS